VVRATSDVADGIVDWAVLLEICDMVSSEPGLASRLADAIEARLKVKDAKVQKLAVTLAETCVKNCGAEVHGAVGTRKFLSAVVAVGETSSAGETRDAALSVLEQWGIAFEPLKATFPAYSDIYLNLKVRGVAFPPRDSEAAPVFTPQQPVQTTTQEDEAALAKLKGDLDVVAEKVALCNEMVPNSPGVANGDDALAEVVGFLEACRPRMLQLIDAGSRGALNDELLGFALKVNDDLAKALDNEERRAANNQHGEQQPPSQQQVPAPLAELSIDDDDDDADLQRGGATQMVKQESGDLLDLGAFDSDGARPPPPPAPRQPDIL